MKSMNRSGKHSSHYRLLIALLRVLSDHEDGGDIFFRNICEFLPNYHVLQLRRPPSSRLFTSTSIIILNPRVYYN
jgi:hypothetical protein